MSIYLVENTAASGKTTYKTNTIIVSAADVAGARLIAADYFDGDASWSDATCTALSESTLDADGAAVGYTFSVIIRGAAAQTEDPIIVSVTPTLTDDLDAMAALLVTALNATDDIAGADYNAPNLTVAETTDTLGDASVELVVTRTGGSGANLASEFHTGVTDEGLAAAALAIAFVADTVVEPQVLDLAPKGE